MSRIPLTHFMKHYLIEDYAYSDDPVHLIRLMPST